MPSAPHSRFVPLLLLVAGSLGPSLPAQDADPLPGSTMIRGTVTALSPNTLTLRSEDGDTVQVAVTPNTRIVHAREPARFTDLHVGDGVGAGGILDPSTHILHAAFLGYVDAEEVRRAEADLGRTYIVGRITGIDLDRLRLTVHRPDNTSQTIAVDESTDFRRGGHSPDPDTSTQNATRPRRSSNAPSPEHAPTGEPITLADIHVGQSIAGRGSIKNGVFTPAELHVFPPHTHPGTPTPQSSPQTNPGPRQPGSQP